MKIQQYCSVCKAEYEMEIVPTADDDGVLWLQCPICMGYLPKVRSVATDEKTTDAAPDDAASRDKESETAVTDSTSAISKVDSTAAEEVVGDLLDGEDEPHAATDAESAAATTAAADDEGLAELAALDPATAQAYRPWQSYEVGDVLHHLAWDDYGVVLAKETLPGRRRVVKVRFTEAGLVRLREDAGE